MSAALQQLFEGKIDFEGQRLVERLVQWTLIIATIVSFIAGFALQSLRITFGILGSSVAAISLVVIPPWPMYRAHPVKWLPVKVDSSKSKK